MINSISERIEQERGTKLREFEKNMLSELRMFPVQILKKEITDEDMISAITLNENIKSLGYTLTPEDIVMLAKSKHDDFYDRLKVAIGEVKAEPMYPGFPAQVMEMEEAEFRLHQLIHYFTTYGVELLTGMNVSKGWLPEYDIEERTLDDKDLVNKKVLKLIDKNDMYNVVIHKILSKNARMTIPELKLVRTACENPERINLEGISVPFKENLYDAIYCVMNLDIHRKRKMDIAYNLCQHTGDVWKCLENYLNRRHWKLKTSEKRNFVRLFEKYPVADFKANLIITNKKAERVIKMLEFLSFNQMSESEAHKIAVKQLRNGELKSWYHDLHVLIDTHSRSTLEFIAKRPGVLVRSINWLLKEGYPAKDIEKHLCENADKLTMRTIVEVINAISSGNTVNEYDPEVSETIVSILMNSLVLKMASNDVPFRNKNVFIDWGEIVPEYSQIDKCEDGGYIRKGMAVKIPEGGRYLRFFCYWDDSKERIDIDLHATGVMENGESVRIGWCNDFRNTDIGIVHSGDITHNDAAEYIDIDLESDKPELIQLKITSYTRVPFNRIDTCFTGMMFVSELGYNKTKLYNPKNIIWSHDLDSKSKDIIYAVIDFKKNVIRLICEPVSDLYVNMNFINDIKEYKTSKLTLDLFMEAYIKAVDGKVVSKPEKADVVLKMGHPESEDEVSIIDNNFFMDAVSIL